MSRPRCHRGAVPFAVLAAALLVPVPLAPAAGPPLLGGVVAATGNVLAAGTTAGGGCANLQALPAKLSKAAARAALLCAVNRARARNGLPALAADRRLRRAAGRHVRDMVRRHYFAHQRAGGPSLSARLRAAGWHGRAAGEAIAWGCGSAAGAAATVAAWLRSPPHLAILLSPAYRRAGIGVAARAPAGCTPGATWVLDAAG
jgi:uncharacterized protein YkwD